MKVLIVGHALCPDRGSEPGLTWNWAWYLGKFHDVWVLAHPEFRLDVEQYLALHPNVKLHIVWLEGSSVFDYWKCENGQHGVRWHYLLWQREAQQVAKRLHSEIDFDLVHHVSMATISAPPKLWNMGIPFVWGPIGGGQTCPPAFVGMFGWGRWREWLRTFRVRLLPYLPALRQSASKAALVLATNIETLVTLRAAGASRTQLFLDNGLRDDAIPASIPKRPKRRVVRVLWASKLQKRKALPLALQAMALLKAQARHLPLTLVIAGNGSESAKCRALAQQMGLSECVQFLGDLSPVEMRGQFCAADVFLFTSIRDSCASVVLEAMCYALPVVTLDMHGVGAYMPSEAGIKVACGSRGITAARLAAALLRLAKSPALRESTGRAGWEYAKTQCWSKRAEQMNDIYVCSVRESALRSR